MIILALYEGYVGVILGLYRNGEKKMETTNMTIGQSFVGQSRSCAWSVFFSESLTS